MEPPRIGVYGGTFDPIHCGHVDVACAVMDRFEMDELLIIPAATPPHKDPRCLSSSHHRFAMAAIATLPLPGVRVSAVEVDSPANPYTFETVARLRAQFGPMAELYFLIGSDSFEEIHTWRRPDLILSKCNVIVAARPGYAMSNPGLAGLLSTTLESTSPGREVPHALGTGADRSEKADRAREIDSSTKTGLTPRIIDMTGGGREATAARENRTAGSIFLTDFVSADFSSTEIRQRVARDLGIQGMVPRGVADYIRKYELYKAVGPVGTH
jgi:nicotinate-nucleotide adenylyltransferase